MYKLEPVNIPASRYSFPVNHQFDNIPQKPYWRELEEDATKHRMAIAATKHTGTKRTGAKHTGAKRNATKQKKSTGQFQKNTRFINAGDPTFISPVYFNGKAASKYVSRAREIFLLYLYAATFEASSQHLSIPGLVGRSVSVGEIQSLLKDSISETIRQIKTPVSRTATSWYEALWVEGSKQKLRCLTEMPDGNTKGLSLQNHFWLNSMGIQEMKGVVARPEYTELFTEVRTLCNAFTPIALWAQATEWKTLETRPFPRELYDRVCNLGVEINKRVLELHPLTPITPPGPKRKQKVNYEGDE